jgi:ABC-2 type transport system ATP-binding protein
LIKLASGQLRPSQGRVRVGGHDAWSTAAKRSLGYSPDINKLYEEMTGREFVHAMARLHGFSRREARERAAATLDELGMTGRSDRRIAGYSHGMRQRTKLAQALVADPEVLLLDEPLSGIDPGGRREINDILLRLAARGKTILVSSHILVEVEHVADTILMIALGRVIASGPLDEIRNLLEDQPLTVRLVTREARTLASRLIALAEVRAVELHDEALVIRTHQPTQFFATLTALAAEGGFEIARLELLDTGAEAVFHYLEQGSS